MLGAEISYNLCLVNLWKLPKSYLGLPVSVNVNQVAPK